MSRKLELGGQRFGRLLVLSEADKGKYGYILWRCRCDCGRITTVSGAFLKSGNTKSCGCLNIEKNTTHGGTNRREYQVWKDMIRRCKNPKCKAYPRYGGRGITVCDEWLKFENFFRDMGERPTPKHSIERIDNDNGYFKDNCKWATKREQIRNTNTPKTNSTGFKGVSFHKATSKYRAYIAVGKKHIQLGIFDTIEAAAEARRQGEIKYRGEEKGVKIQ